MGIVSSSTFEVNSPQREAGANSKQSFSTSEVAEYCHVTADTIRKWAEAGRIRVFKTPGGHRRIRREDLLRFLRENAIPVHTDLADGREKVLVVDTESSAVGIIQRFLERSERPFYIEVAGDPFEAGRRMATFQPDIVFLNVGLPGVDGVEMCRRIKNAPDCVNISVIGMMSVENGALADQVQDAGATVALRKPFTPDDLRRALAMVGVEVS